ncbi:hypothetical protein LDENG_00287560 [Lucifuga dentata]|nr:hypothetical protein LDENG_00287560 [Lucifuga dentata]
MVVVDKQQKRAVVIDVAVPADSNIRKKEHQKIQKYQGLKEELGTGFKREIYIDIYIYVPVFDIMESWIKICCLDFSKHFGLLPRSSKACRCFVFLRLVPEDLMSLRVCGVNGCQTSSRYIIEEVSVRVRIEFLQATLCLGRV